MKKFIYISIGMNPYHPRADEIQFTRLGEEGWELVGFENGAAWFKKEVE
jgi:hypothetical protein